MNNEIKQIEAFTNIPYVTLEGDSGSAQPQSMFLSDVRELNVGQGGDLVFRADKQGIWLGAEKFADAPFSVSMAGLMTLQQGIGSKTFTATPTTPYHVGDLWAGLSAGDLKVSTVDRESGAYVAGDWVLASGYKLEGGITTIIGNTITTGYVNALAVTVLGAVTAGSLTGLTITGGTIQTATSGERVVMKSSEANHILFQYDSTVYGYLETDRVSASDSSIVLYMAGSLMGLRIGTATGASNNNYAFLDGNGGTFETSGNASNTFIGFFKTLGTMGIEIVSGGAETAFVEGVPFQVRTKLKIPVGTNLY